MSSGEDKKVFLKKASGEKGGSVGAQTFCSWSSAQNELHTPVRPGPVPDAGPEIKVQLGMCEEPA